MIIDLMLRHFPVNIVRHPDHEGDDTIYNLIKRSASTNPWVVISNDSDFTQLLDEFDNVSIYNPMAKSFVEKHESDYVSWKALRGDASDNIKGIVSDAKATFLMDEPEELEKFFNDPTNSQRFTENHKLIKFITWSEDEALLMQSSASPVRDWDAVMSVFDMYGFKSMTNEKARNKFVDTFDHLFSE
jgi:5'-3' exonuclease